MELEAPQDVVGHPRDRLVRLPRERALALAAARRRVRDLVHEPPEPAQEADDPLDPARRPLHVLIGRAHEEDVQPHGVGAVARRRRRPGPSTLPFVFDIFVPPSCTQPWWKTPRERLAEADHPPVVHRLHEEARVEEVPRRVVDPADVLRDRQPVVDDEAVERRLVVVRVDVAEEVPRRVDERVHRVGVALRRAAALGHATFMYSSFWASGDLPFGA